MGQQRDEEKEEQKEQKEQKEQREQRGLPLPIRQQVVWKLEQAISEMILAVEEVSTLFEEDEDEDEDDSRSQKQDIVASQLIDITPKAITIALLSIKIKLGEDDEEASSSSG